MPLSMKRRSLYPVLMVLAMLATTPLSLLAHEGHGVTPASNALHYIMEWVHGAPLVLLGAALVLTVLYFSRRSVRERR